ncbi:3-deoxy-manno-octulosonate cytidylyltransferase [Sphingomonas sp. GlSt437]|uniref:3-deoxy-manno-octulosonate cytidylyltransferase n=1 Tax=Sphingomonas sp. GlSt437 TaxID=3389970 RepID=UPI003A8BC1B7
MTAEASGTGATIIIPARYQSSRYPGKPLAAIKGAAGASKPLIQRSYEAASSVAGANRVIVATDDARIADVVRSFGGQVVMTPESCANGTERVAAAIADLPGDSDIIVNFQGDALLTPPDLVASLIKHMAANTDCAVATAAVRCSPTAYRYLIEDQAAGRVGGTTVVTDARGNALYFSKRVLPHLPPGHPAEADPPVLLHVGLYAYRRTALAAYIAAGETALERLEGLEQLRFLVHGVRVAVVVSDPPAWDLIELNNPSDLPAIEAILATRGIE